MFDDIFAIAAGNGRQRPETDLGDRRHDAIEKETVVRHEDDGMGIPDEKLLEPVSCLQIEMVRRLVHQKETRSAQQQLRQRNPHLPPTGERVRWAVEVAAAEAKPPQHGGHP